MESSQTQASRRKQPTNLRNQNAKRALHAAQNGQYRKAMKALTSEGAAPADETVLKDMLSKYPQVPPPGTPPGPTPSPIKLTESIVSKRVKSFPPGSAPGPSGLRPRRWPEAGLARTHLASIVSFSQREQSVGLATVDEREVLREAAQESRAPLGT